MRRRRWTAVIIAVLVVLGAAPFAVKAAVERRMRGPAAPACEHLPVARSGFERPVQLTSPRSPGARLYDVEPSAAVLRDGALVVDDERRWLHAVWTQPVLEGGAARSRIFWSRLRLRPPDEP